MRARGEGSSLGRVEGLSRAMLATARPFCYHYRRYPGSPTLTTRRRPMQWSICMLKLHRLVVSLLLENLANISQGNVATRSRCGGLFTRHVHRHLL